MRPIQTLPIPLNLSQKLQEEGYYFCEDILNDQKEIKEEIKKLLISCVGLHEESWNCFQDLFFVPKSKPSLQILKDELKTEKIVTLSEAVDQILGGGIFLREVLEFCGASGSGKTQMSLQLCISVQLPTCLGGVEGEALYIDTDSSFTPKRLKGIAQSCIELLVTASEQGPSLKNIVANINEIKLLDGVHYINIQDNIQLLAVSIMIEEFVKANNKIKLIVIDSFTFPFLDPNISSNLVRTQQICRVVKSLQKLATDYNLAVIITNQLTTKIIQQEPKLAPALGENYGHMISKRVILGNIQNSIFSAAIFKSSYLSNFSAEFEITGEGVRDV